MPQKKKRSKPGRERAALVASRLREGDIQRSLANEAATVRRGRSIEGRVDPEVAEAGQKAKGSTRRVLSRLASAIGAHDTAQTVRLTQRIEKIKKSPGFTMEVADDFWPNEDGVAKGELADEYDSTEDHSSPTIR